MPDFKTTALTLIYLGLWAQIGVLTRNYLDRMVTLGCRPGDWGPCFTASGGNEGLYSLYFAALPSNILGSYIIGLLSPAAALNLKTTSKVAFLPPGHSWHWNDLHLVGLRTGFCGCLTTFASWLVSEVAVTGINQNRYWDMAFGLIIGTMLAGASLVAGEYTALFLNHLWTGGDIRLYPKTMDPVAETVVVITEEVDREGFEDGNLGARLSKRMGSGSQGKNVPNLSRFSPELDLTYHSAVSELVDDDQAVQQQDQFKDTSKPKDVPTTADNKAEDTGGTVFNRVTKGFLRNKTDFLTLLLYIATTALFIALLAAYDNGSNSHKDTRTWFFAVVVAPPGCYLRWYLSRFNFQWQGFWKYFPLGTFVANMLGTAISFGMQIIIERVKLSYWGSVVVVGVQLGFCGSLTTVSTWIYEVRQSSRLAPESQMGAFYMFLSLLTATAIGFALYGWAHWVS